MKKDILNKIVPVVTLVTYLMMVTVNALANALPINGKGTGEISDAYANLFAPAGLTFAIWGLIYLLLLGYSVYQLGYYRTLDEDKKKLLIKTGIVFSISSVANILWIFAWHYEVIGLSLLLMLCILICLITINRNLRKEEFSLVTQILIKLPFTVYFGWITVAAIANVTTFLVSIGWNRFGLSEVFWTDTIILVGGIIGFLGIIYYKSLSYGGVVIWAYIGIIIEHLSSDGFAGQYTSIIVSVIIAIIMLVFGESLLLRVRLRRR